MADYVVFGNYLFGVDPDVPNRLIYARLFERRDKELWIEIEGGTPITDLQVKDRSLMITKGLTCFQLTGSGPNTFVLRRIDRASDWQ